MVQAAREAEKGANILNNPEERKKFKSACATVTHYFSLIDQQKESIKEQVAEISKDYGIDKKIIRKLITTMYKHNYSDIVSENRHFEELYELMIEGQLRDSPSDELDEDTDE